MKVGQKRPRAELDLMRKVNRRFKISPNDRRQRLLDYVGENESRMAADEHDAESIM